MTGIEILEVSSGAKSKDRTFRIVRSVAMPMLQLALLVCVAKSQSLHKVWVTFTDKSPVLNERLLQAYENLSPEARARRAKELHATEPLQIVSVEDLPLTEGYLDSLQQMGFTVLCKSKWLNGV